MLTSLELQEPQLQSVLGRASPLTKLAVAIAWLIGLATLRAPGPALFLAAAALGAGFVLGRLDSRRVLVALGPLAIAALSIALTTLLFAGSNGDPTLREVGRLGPFRITGPAVDAALAVASRVLAIVSVGVVFAQTTEPTRLVDALVQQARVSPRFAYGALAAYQAAPQLAADLVTLRAARRVRGLGTMFAPRILVGLLVRALRHADQLALAMDARAFGTGPRTTYRPIRWRLADLAVGLGGGVVLWLALVL